MNKIFLGLLKLFVLPFLLILLYSHYIALMFAASIIVALIAGWGFEMKLAWTYLSVAWKIYVGLGIFTFFIAITFSYQQCCVGIKRFYDHLRGCHAFKNIFSCLLGAIIWPWYWFRLDYCFKDWEMGFPVILVNALEYWFVSSWKGITVTYQNFQTGKETKTRIKDHKDVYDSVHNAINENFPEKK